jgi:hypothetical protein
VLFLSPRVSTFHSIHFFAMLRLRTAALLLLAISGSAFALGPHTTLEIVSKNIAPDGFLRPATLANGVFPGPIITAIKGQEFAVNVVDNLTETSLDLATSIHWHGILQHHTNYVDGSASVSQCPLVPNESFLYKFNALSQSVISLFLGAGYLTNPLPCYTREHFGITVTIRTSTAMDCVVL